MKILAYQPLIRQVRSVEDRRAHVRNMIRFLEAQCRREEDISLIILPELSTIEYASATFKRLSVLAEPLYGETFEAMAALAKRAGCAVSYGFPRVANGQYYISQAVVGTSGQCLTSYDKLHLAQFGASVERDYFSSGSKLGIFELDGFRFGIIICYDFRFSDLMKLLVNEHQVDAILHPVAFTRDSTFASWHPFVVCRALENQVFFLSLNRAGPAWGNSIFCPPWIEDRIKPVILGEKEEAHLFTLDKSAICSARETYPFREDRLADYAVLATGDEEQEAGE
jgi:predicted amidohydrolase